MFTLRDSTLVHAPIERCFALSTHVALVAKELGMTPVAGRTSGCVQAGDTVHWKGWQLGFPNFHVSLISAFERPFFFQDRMLRGRFRSFEHDHRFREVEGGVLFEDELRFTMPLGWAGATVGHVVLVPHIRRLMRERFAMLKEIAEGEAWRDFVCA
jgi:ligand-binding SRPBCC domain-containing protein